MVRRTLYGIMCCIVCLNNDLPRLGTAPASSHRLLQQIVGQLCTAIITAIQHGIPVDDTNQCHIFKIQPLRNHLCSHKNIRPVLTKGSQQLLVGIFFPCRIRIHANNPGIRKFDLHKLLQLLRTQPEIPPGITAAFGTVIRYRHRISAGMAFQLFIILVIGHRHLTVRTHYDMAAADTAKDWCIASAIQKQKDLFLSLQPLIHCSQQLIAQQIALSPTDRLAHFHQLYIRKAAIDAAWHFNQPINTLNCSGIGFQRRRGTCQNDQRMMMSSSLQSDIATMIAWRGILLIAGIVLFIHDDDTQIIKRHKNRTACTDHDLHLMPADKLILLVFLLCIQSGMIDCHMPSKACRYPLYHLWSQRDFRYQNQNLLSLLHDRPCQLQKHLCFPTAGRTMQ